MSAASWRLHAAAEEEMMKARPGDRLVVEGHRVGEHPRDGEILEVRGADGGPPFLVRWEDGRVALVFPGPDARIDPLAERGAEAAG